MEKELRIKQLQTKLRKAGSTNDEIRIRRVSIAFKKPIIIKEVVKKAEDGEPVL